MSADPGKDVVYVDVDDEITGIIDKVTSAKAKVVALVLPKRATVFQSIVNMKLLKKRAESAHKHVVLITSETGLMPLAGAVGLHVAKTLQSKPEIPEAFQPAGDDTNDVNEDESPEDFDTGKEGATPVGNLSDASQPARPSINDTSEDTVELDNSELPASKDAGEKDIAALAAAGGSGKASKGKKLKVPNFNRFRKLLVFGGLGLIVLIVAGVFALRVLPKAKITIKTNTSTVNANLAATLDTGATAVNPSSSTIPAQTQQQQKANTVQVSATGKQNTGDKATGTIVMTAQACAPSLGTPDPIPAGTGVSSNGLAFVTGGTATFTFAGFSGGSCASYKSGSITITAQQGGSQYNVGSNTSFTVAGYSSISASGSTSGGTDNIVTIVQQSDIDGAKTKLSSQQDTNAAKQQLEQQLQSAGLYPIEATFNASAPNISPSTQVGQQASNVTVTESVTYTMYGAKESNIKTVLDGNIDQQIDTSKQSIQQDGLGQNTFTVPTPGAGKTLQINMQATAIIGPHIVVNQLKAQIVGKKSGDVKNLIKALPGVTDVRVHYSPFWVSSAPAANKITITFQK